MVARNDGEDPAEPPSDQTLAGNVERVFPQIVRTDEHGHKHLATYTLIGPLIEAVKELDARLTALEQLNNAAQ